MQEEKIMQVKKTILLFIHEFFTKMFNNGMNVTFTLRWTIYKIKFHISRNNVPPQSVLSYDHKVTSTHQVVISFNI